MEYSYFISIFEDNYYVENDLWLIVLCKDLGHFIEELQDSDYWVGGDEGSFTNDSNENFNTLEDAEDYYNTKYEKVLVFEYEDERDEMEENGDWIN